MIKPELVRQWQYGSDLITDWKESNDIRFRTEFDGRVFEQWGKAPDDKRFLMIRALETKAPDNIIVVENWFEELKAKSRK